MSKIRNLPETTSLQPNDLIYAVDVSEGANAGRKATVATLKQAVIANSAEIPYDNTNSTLAADDVREAIDELDGKVNDHSTRHAPDGLDGLAIAAPVAANANGNNDIGTANSYSRSDHKHNISTGTPVTQTPDQTNSAGVSTAVSRADHVHNIPTEAPTTPLSPATTDSEGVGSAFARHDHTHSIATGVVGEMSSIEPDDAADAGVLNKFARIDHQHAISTDAATTLSPDGGNSEGVSTSFSRADHKHDVPADAPTTTLSPATTNAEGSGSSFSRNDHTHAIATGLVGEVSSIQPDDAAAAGVIDKFARIDHKHAIAAAAPSTQTPDQANSEGVSTSFARADHIHNIPADTAVSVSTSTVNAEGSSSSFARADHTHAVSLANQAASATADDTTTSLTDVVIAGMTLTPAAGTYLAIFSTSTVNSGNGAERNYISLYSAGTQVTGTERKVGIAGGAYTPVSTQAVVTVNGSQAIDVRWRVIAGTGTVAHRRLILVKVG